MEYRLRNNKGFIRSLKVRMTRSVLSTSTTPLESAKKDDGLLVSPAKTMRTSCAGFTLIEMLVFVAIVVAVGVLVVATLVSLSGAYATLKVTQSINESATSALNRVVFEIRQAYGIDVATSTFGVAPGVLGLDSKDDMGIDVSTVFYVSDGALSVIEDGASAGALTRSDVMVTHLSFERLTGASSEAVRIFLVLEGSVGSVTKEEVFHATAVLRGAYGP